MSTSDLIALAALIISALAWPAMSAVHRNRTIEIVKEERPETLKACDERTAATIKLALSEERERARELFAAKTEVAEMKAQVGQLVANTQKLDEKLERMHELLLRLAREK